LSKKFRQPTLNLEARIAPICHKKPKFSGLRGKAKIQIISGLYIALQYAANPPQDRTDQKRGGIAYISSNHCAVKTGACMSALKRMTVAACALLPLAAAFSAQADELTFRCVNTASHATWNLKIDLAKSTADGFQAQINAASVTWRDVAHGGSYELDRATGKLTFSNSSSTGGYMLFHHCQQLK
jgi:hypothetical protein